MVLTLPRPGNHFAVTVQCRAALLCCSGETAGIGQRMKTKSKGQEKAAMQTASHPFLGKLLWRLPLRLDPEGVPEKLRFLL